jgi:hypothetical protein
MMAEMCCGVVVPRTKRENVCGIYGLQVSYIGLGLNIRRLLDLSAHSTLSK